MKRSTRARVFEVDSFVPDINGWTFATSSRTLIRGGTVSIKVLTPSSMEAAI